MHPAVAERRDDRRVGDEVLAEERVGVAHGGAARLGIERGAVDDLDAARLEDRALGREVVEDVGRHDDASAPAHRDHGAPPRARSRAATASANRRTRSASASYWGSMCWPSTQYSPFGFAPGSRRDHPARPGRPRPPWAVGLVGDGDEGGILEDLAVEAELPAGEARVAEAGRVLGVAKGAVERPPGRWRARRGRSVASAGTIGQRWGAGRRNALSPRERSPSPTVMPARRGVAAAISWARASPRRRLDHRPEAKRGRRAVGGEERVRLADRLRSLRLREHDAVERNTGERGEVVAPHGVSRPLTVTSSSCRWKPPSASVRATRSRAVALSPGGTESSISKRSTSGWNAGAASYAPGPRPARRARCGAAAARECLRVRGGTRARDAGIGSDAR